MSQATLNNAEYRAAVLETESKPAELNFGPATLLVSLNLAVAAGNLLDQVKRAIYYGKPMDQQKAMNALALVRSTSDALQFAIGTGRYRDPQDIHFYMEKLPVEVAKQLDPAGLNLRLLHAGLGKFTESSEFIEAILPALLGGQVDAVNLLEEVGDGSWYDEVALDELGFSRDQSNGTNIKKLQDKKAGRYKKGAFSTEAAVVRDLSAERNVLEAATNDAQAKAA
ncbi:hypothetical protein ACODYM_28790 [Burkholderia gladioli]|uniref:hypothetical protein n=1 Tax=Burkholderia gladioli TaxID=28095 RepID=UPI003B51324C